MSNPELERCLTKAAVSFGLRDMLTKLGLPEDAGAKLELQVEEGANTEVLGGIDIPTTEKKDYIESGSISLKSFRFLVADEFITPAVNLLELDKYVNNEKAQLNVKISSDTPEFQFAVLLRLNCKVPCGPNCCLVWC